MNSKNGLISIFTPTKNGQGIYGTAFPVAPGQIMTARHLISPDTKNDSPGLERDTEKNIRVNWYYSKELKGYREIEKDDVSVAWRHENHDLVLLNVEIPADCQEKFFLSPSRSFGGKSWHSDGFPRAAKVEGLRTPKSFSGTCISKADREKYFECNVTAWPENETEWGGASGMPIVVDGYVVGVAVQVPQGFGGRTIHAAPIWKAWDDGLRDHLNYQEDLQHLKEKVKKAITRINDLGGGVKNAFSRRFDLNGAYHNEWCDKAVKAVLFEHDPGDVFGRLCDAMSEIDQENQHCPELYELAQTIAPALIRRNNTAVDWLRDRLGTGSALLGDIPVGFHSMAELIVAGAEERDARFLKRRDEHDTPPGEDFVPFEPWCTSGNIEVAVIGAFKDRYPEFNEDEQKGNFSAAIIDHLARTLNARVTEDSVAELQNHLKRLRERKKPTPYLAFEVPQEGNSGREELLAEIKRLSDKVPELIIIVLDPSNRVPEDDVIRNFCFLIPFDASGERA